MHSYNHLLLFIFLGLGLVGCNNAFEKNSAANQKITDAYGCTIGPSEPAVNEASYCSDIVSPSDPVTITGSAIYKRRIMSTAGLLGVSSTDYPIRHSEIAIIDSSGTVIQCGETDVNGDFSISVPKGSSSISVQVRSRSNNSYLKASILDNHGDMNYYSVSSSLTPDASKSIGTISAPYNGTLEGGAFNILDKLLDANDYLRTNTSTCASITGCTPFDVAPKVQVFWEKGCNPGAYYDSGPVSFYLPGNSRLYILGGEESDVDYSDTDHFDDIIILHEYGHFLEDIFSKSDSPGGYHDANTIVDPRLAWSEAWASFLGASIRGITYYLDTYGNSNGATGTFFAYNIETDTPKRDPDSAGYTVPSGEGNFREFGILRALWDTLDIDSSDTDNDGVEADFNEIWASFAGSSGIKNEPFINVGTFFEKLSSFAGATDVSSILTSEKIISGDTSPADNDNKIYAYPISSGGTYCTISITPSSGNNLTEDGDPSNSNLFASNDFYTLTVPATGTYALTLTILTGTGDLDLFLFEEDHSLASDSAGNRYYAIGSSKTRLAGAGTESMSGTLTAGNYLINVHSYTGSGLNANTYQLTINGVTQCL